MNVLRETYTNEYYIAERKARFSEHLLYLGFPSYRYIEERGIGWFKEIISIKKRRKYLKHLAELMVHVEGFKKNRSNVSGQDLAEMIHQDTKKMKKNWIDVNIISNSGLLESSGSDPKSKVFVEKYNKLMKQYPLSRQFNLPSRFGP